MESKHKNALIGALLAVVFVMAVGYAAFAQQLTINGQAEITSTWDVKIVDISVKGTPVGTASDTVVPSADSNYVQTNSAADFQGTVATFKALLQSPRDSITYTVSIKNNGTLPAKLDTVGWSDTAAAEASPIQYSYTTVPATIAAGATESFEVTVTYDGEVTQQPASEDLSKNATLVMNYVQNKD